MISSLPKAVRPLRRSAATLLIMTLFWISAPAAAAQNRFISDQLGAELRQQPGDTQAVTGQVAAGTPVEVITTSPNGWTQIRTRAGQMGWVRNNQLMNTPPVRPRMDQASRELAELREQNQLLRNQLRALETATLQNGPELERLRAETQRLRDSLKLSQEGLHLAEANQKLREEVASLRLEIQTLEQEAERLGDRSRRDTFLAGALVMIIGILAGLGIPRLFGLKRPKRWDRW
ncbi:MAG TPA: TIGR04211 family SH3 domain-containing protein [Candidatus Acidoferrales bacterium]|nr:TIGR04211 family SH3 domain-containing protein [Candidatus Acidoferrales bacterium]